MVTLLPPPPHELSADDPNARPRKSSAAFRTISEVADDLDVAQHVLRFWESKFPQVRPLKRGGGRRYYRPEDVELLRQIRSLLYEEGYTIKGAQKLLRGRRSRAAAEEPPPAAAPAPPAPRAAPAASVARAVPPEARRRLKGVRNELMEIRELLARARAELP
jgi:DNA-binding transcriptional MerR regulator